MPKKFTLGQTMNSLFFLLTASFLAIGACIQAAPFVMPSNPTAVIETDKGNIEVRLFPKVAPKAVENFLRLSEEGYYNNTIFHRVIAGFMNQGGDPLGTGTGGQSIWKKPFEDEIDPKVTFNRAGLLAMANAGPKTNGSQFFITVAKTPWLDGKHTIFGEVVGGFDVVEAINKEEYPTRSRVPVKVLKIYLKD